MKEILDKVSDEAIEEMHDHHQSQGEKFNKIYGATQMRNLLLPEIERLIEENAKLKMTIKRLQPRRLIDED